MQQRRILIVDDEAGLRELVRINLEHEGFDVFQAENGAQSLTAVQEHQPDMVIMDVMMPEMDGWEACRKLREFSTVPVLMLTARVQSQDIVTGLDSGADDYLGKPFSMGELVGRVRAILRRREMDRAEGEGVATREVGDLRLDLVRRTIAVGDRPVDLTPLEFRLLAVLAARPGQAVSRREIVAEVWRSSHPGDRRACDVHVKNVRRKLERDPSRPERLVTVRGVGYMLREV